MTALASEIALKLLPGAVAAAASLLDYALSLARAARLSEEQSRAELEPLYRRLQSRADRVEGAKVYDPDGL